MQLVFYSLALPPDGSREDLVGQFGMSVHTLRTFNPAIHVVLFLYGYATRDLVEVCSRFNVMVHDQGDYATRLAELFPRAAHVLSQYPVLHKFLNYRELSQLDVSQVLYCDTDTVFQRDVAMLFEMYAQPDVVAREEVHSVRSAYGINQDFLDESLFRRLAVFEGSAPIPPLNTGVVLLNNQIWKRFDSLVPRFLDYVWRFLCWMALNPAPEESEYGDFPALEDARSSLDESDLGRLLIYPSRNQWIVEEVATWLVLGLIPGLSTCDFRSCDVVQNGEFENNHSNSDWIACHYFSQNTGRITQWLQDQR